MSSEASGRKMIYRCRMHLVNILFCPRKSYLYMLIEKVIVNTA